MKERCPECGQIMGFSTHECPEYESAWVRFWSKVEFTESCWLWRNGTRNGYGAFAPKHGQSRYAHRLAYEFCVGPIPDGLELDHLCRTLRCIRPDHLEPVSKRINVLRGVGSSALNAAKTHCVHGHPFDDENTYAWRGHRYCKTCRLAIRERQQAKRSTTISTPSLPERRQQ